MYTKYNILLEISIDDMWTNNELDWKAYVSMIMAYFYVYFFMSSVI